jgi:hypothetical protein
MSKYLKKPIDSATFVSNATLRTGLTPDDPAVADGRDVHGDILSHSGAGAIPLTGAIVKLTTTGANALTLADGVDGQVITIAMIVDGGDGTLTPANKQGFSTVTFNDAGDVCTLLFTNSKWFVLANFGCAVV